MHMEVREHSEIVSFLSLWILEIEFRSSDLDVKHLYLMSHLLRLEFEF